MTNYDFEKTTNEHYKEIFKKKLADGVQYGLISYDDNFEEYIENRDDISNWFVMDSSLNAERLAEIFEFIDQVYLSSKLELTSKSGGLVTGATGTDLDALGKLIFCPRPPATRAGVELTFTLARSLLEDVTEPAGVQVANTQGIVFETVEDLYFAEGTTECKVQAYAVNAGRGSRVVANSLTRIISRLENIHVTVAVTNQASAAGGYDAYTDDEYRELIKHWIEIHLKGHQQAYVNYFANVEGVDGYRLIPNWDQSGTIKIVVDPGDSYTLNRIYEDLRRDVIQLDDDIVLMAPILKAVDISVECNVDIDMINPYSSEEKEDIASKIKTAILQFVDDMSLGEDFIPHKLSVYLDKEIPQLKNIGFGSPAEPVSILDEEKVTVGNLEIVME
ncbi:MAG: baseplate J/gp47 family protein [Methanobrevibacter sp.]|nr:baseplate J/gp47 family protein [Methanobrevibacter sp.]